MKISFNVILIVIAALFLSVGVVMLIVSGDERVGDGSRSTTRSPLTDGSVSNPSKSSRPPKKEARDDGGYPAMSEKWLETEAGKAFIAEMKVKQIRPGMKVVEQVNPQIHAEIRQRMRMLYRYSKRNPESQEPIAEPVLSWKEGLQRLLGVISFSLGQHGSDPRLTYIDQDYFLYCHEETADFSSGFAVRKSDGAIFQWGLNGSTSLPSD